MHHVLKTHMARVKMTAREPVHDALEDSAWQRVQNPTELHSVRHSHAAYEPNEKSCNSLVTTLAFSGLVRHVPFEFFPDKLLVHAHFE